MSIGRTLLCCIAVVTLATVSRADEPKKKPASKTNANYRQSLSKKSTTVTNPYALTSKKKVKEDPEATKAFRAFTAQYWKLKSGKKYDEIQSSVDELLGKHKKLTADQKSQLYYYKADACFSAEDNENALKTAQAGIRIGGEGAGSCAAVAVKAANAEGNEKLTEGIIAAFEKSNCFANGTYYATLSDLRLKQKRFDEAFEYLKAYGRQPRLSNYDKITIYKGFAAVYTHRKSYANAIAQYKAIKQIPKIDPYNEGNADMQIAACYLKMNNKAKALETYNSLLKTCKHAGIRKNAQNEIKKLTAKPKPAKKKPAPRKRK